MKKPTQSLATKTKKPAIKSKAPSKQKPSAPPKSKPSAAPKIHVMIVDDHPLFRAGLRRVLELEKDLDVQAEAIDGGQALEMAREIKPQVILMDVNLPVMNGL